MLLHSTAAILAVSLLLATLPAGAQVGGGYDLRHHTIDGGGATFSSGGGYRLGGTAGQPDTAKLTGGGLGLAGGFWPGSSAPPPTVTPTATRTSTATITRTATLTATVTMASSATPTVPAAATLTATRTASRTSTATASGTRTRTRTPTASPTATTGERDLSKLAGNCNGDEETAINELQQCINLFLGTGSLLTCLACDVGGEAGEVGITDLQAVINCYLDPTAATCPLVGAP